ncbi:hypothetical protein FRB99_000665 [Tulasnella sp. 403]|nr:hypothetical protein FRB99_000665 [Tulasnella sp. 403]
MDPTYVAGLHNLLLQTVAPDTNVIKAATAQLNQVYYKDPTCVPALFEILATSPEQNIRQLAAVELRKRIFQGNGKHWAAQTPDIRQAIKAKVLETVLTEQASIVRHSIARVISAIAEIEFQANTWPEVLPFLNQATSSQNAAHREIGAFVLFSILEPIMEGLQQSTSALFPTVSRLLADPESFEVKITAVRSLGSLAQYIEADDKSDIKTFQNMLPEMFKIVSTACETDNEDGARYGFDVIETLLILEAPLLAKNIPDLVRFCLAIGKNKNVDDAIRQMALNSLNWTIKYKKSKIQSLGLANEILEVLLPIGSEADPEDNDEDSPSRLAFRAVDCLATVLPPQQVFPPLHHLVTGYMQSPDPGLRKAAMMAFGVTVEGCSEFIRPHMKSLWPLIDSGLSDSEPIVRKAACIAFACICEWLEEECAERHAILLPAILRLTDDPETQSSACTALDAYLEILELEIGQYLPLIMQQLGKLLTTAPMKIKAVVTGAIGSAAHASKGNFAPYFEECMTRLKPFLQLTEEGEQQDLRGISTDAIGTMAEAVGKDVFRRYVPELMKSAFDGVQLRSARLKECSFLFFGVMAKVFEEEFAPYLEHVVPLLVESLGQSEGGTDDVINELTAQHPEAFGSGDVSSDSIAAPAGDTSVVELDPATAISVNSAIAIEKEIAADTMGTIFEAVHGHFLPYLEPCTLALLEVLSHYYEGIRKAAIGSLFQFIRSFYELSESPLWEPGAQVTVPLHDKVVDLIKHALNPILDLWSTEDDKSVVSTLCQDLAETMSKVGPGLLKGHAEVRSNAAFACGVLVENSETDTAQGQTMLLSRLKPLFEVGPNSSSPELHGRDNAAGAVSRMILKNAGSLPLEQVLPVLYAALPLKNDYLENAPVYRAIFHLFRTNGQVMLNYVDALLPAFAAVLAPGAEDQLTPDVRAELVQLVHLLKDQVPDKIAAVGLANVA